MEIKQGDKVRVSRDIPQFYLEYNSYRMFEIEHRVVDVNMEDGFALLDSIPPKFTTILPTKYLVKVEAEAKEAKIKLGDMVRVKGNLHEPFCLDADLHLETTNIPPHAVSQKEWKVIKVENRRDCAGHIYTLNHDDSFIYNIPEDCVELIEPKAEADVNEKLQEEYASFMSGRTPISFADRIERMTIQRRMRRISQEDFLREINPAEHEVTPNPRYIPKIMFNTEFWVKYEADLAKELSVVYAKQGIDPIEAVGKAKEIIKQLKQNK